MDTFDIPGAYLHEEIPRYKGVLINIRRGFVDIMCQFNPEYKQHVTYENGNKVLYLLVLTEIYSFIEPVLLWYKLFSDTLEGLGFEINPYDRFVANNNIEGKQCTISWYMDDNKLSHKNSSVISDIINKVKKHFRYLSFVRGKRNTLFGMKIEINNNIIQVDMIKQL